MIGLGGLARAVIDGLLAQRKRDGVTWLSWLNNWQKCSTAQEVNRNSGRQMPIAKSFGQSFTLFE
jgi:hypothetical protein